jgi:hypothetical protein
VKWQVGKVSDYAYTAFDTALIRHHIHGRPRQHYNSLLYNAQMICILQSTKVHSGLIPALYAHVIDGRGPHDVYCRKNIKFRKYV